MVSLKTKAGKKQKCFAILDKSSVMSCFKI